LISSKEIYLFLKNLYGLLTHPFKTIVQIRKKPDRSQTILVLGLPVWGGLGALGFFGGVGLGAWFFGVEGRAFLRFYLAFLVTAVALIISFTIYIGCWLQKYWSWRKGSFRSRDF
jgi:hypothetical protein